MEIYRIAGKKAVALLDLFVVPVNAFLIGIQHVKLTRNCKFLLYHDNLTFYVYQWPRGHSAPSPLL